MLYTGQHCHKQNMGKTGVLFCKQTLSDNNILHEMYYKVYIYYIYNLT